MSVVAVVQGVGFEQIHVMGVTFARIFMKPKTAVATFLAVTALLPSRVELRAQDVPGIEICTVEKTMERRTSCLQSNIDFLQKTITRLSADHQQKLDAANRQIESLKATIAGLQNVVADLKAAQKQPADDLKKKLDAPGAKESGK
jgi:septal ring factor EnvC (AmiA/AmiB activator)